MNLRKLDNIKKELFILSILIIFFYRSPYIFLNGRFMAEEGSIYFANAYKYDFFYSLFFIDFNSGYLNLWANFSGIISNFFSLLLAPLISNYLALIPKVIILYLALYKDSIFLKTFFHKVLFCLLIFLSPLNIPEIWLNSINSQIFFCIIAFTLCFINYSKQSKNFYFLILIFISGLTGIYSCILLPVFYFKFYLYKTKQDLLNFIVLFFCTVTQILIVLYAKTSNLIYSGKLNFIDTEILINYVYNVLVKVFIGTSLTKYIYYNYLNLDLFLLSIIIIIFFTLILALLFYFIRNNKIINSDNRFIILSLLFVLLTTSVIVMIGAIDQKVGGRYSAVPSFYTLCLVLTLLNIFNKFKIKYLFLCLILFSIFSGAYEFKPPKDRNHYLDCNGCPNWKDEIKKFNDDKNYTLKIWPYPKKSISLN